MDVIIKKEEDQNFYCDDSDHPIIYCEKNILDGKTNASNVVTLRVDPNAMCIKEEPCTEESEFGIEYLHTEVKEELPVKSEDIEIKPEEIGESTVTDCEKEKNHNLITSKRKKDGPTVFQCTLCQYTTTERQAHWQHQDTHKDATDHMYYKCHHCDHRTTQKTALKLHLLTHMDPAKVTWYKCTLCPYASKLKGGLKVHMLTHKNISERPAKICSYKDCQNSRRKSPNRRMFKFPVADKERCKVWIINSGNPILTRLSDYSLQRRFLCNEHFPTRGREFCMKLSHDSVPFKYGEVNECDILQLHQGSGKICSYKDCQNSRRKSPNIRMFKFPVTNWERCKVWIANSGNPILAKLSKSVLNRSFLCSEHFPENFMDFSMKLPHDINPFKYGEDKECDILQLHQELHKNVYPPSKKTKFIPFVPVPSTSTDMSIKSESI